MASLGDLLIKEVHEREKLSQTRKPLKPRDRSKSEESITLPIYICHDRKGYDSSNQKGERAIRRRGSRDFSSRRLSSDSKRSNKKSIASESLRKDEPAMDEVAIRAVISILSGYIGKYLKDASFREFIREKCNSSLVRKKQDSENGIFKNMDLGIQSVEKLVEYQGTKMESKTKALENSIRLLSIVASLNSKKAKNGSSCGKSNSHLSACAQLYLAIVYKIEKNDEISAKYLLQVFCDSPSLARTHLLPDLWEHLFLPHLLHLKIWYNKELELLSNTDKGHKEKKVKNLSKIYNNQMDMGTVQFAQYYKDWLKGGAKAPALPTVPLPSKPNSGSSRRSSDSYKSHSSINKHLYRAVFGPTKERQSMDFGDPNQGLVDGKCLKDEKNVIHSDEDSSKLCNNVHNENETHRRSLSLNYRNLKTELWPETQKPKYSHLISCRGLPNESLVTANGTAKTSNFIEREKQQHHSSELNAAIATICSSDSLNDCEIAIRLITKAWLNCHGDKVIENALSKAPIIEGILEVMYSSDDDEVLELTISILAEVVARNEVIRQVVLHLDSQLEIFFRLLRSTSLFLKSAILLYLLKPEAKQMVSVEWMPLVLRVLEFGDHLQTLFTVRCSPKEAAFYFLNQLLRGFDEGRNLENARQVVSLGGLSLLVKRYETGDIQERCNAVSAISICIRADGSCRGYLADNLNKASLLELIVLGKNDYSGCAFALLAELLCLDRITQILKFLDELKNGWDGINTMHVLFVYLQKAPAEERPLVAVILLLLDIMGDPSKCSIYREEAVEIFIEGLECKTCSEQIQRQSAKALLTLGGRFTCTGEASTEEWILSQAGFKEVTSVSSLGREVVLSDFMHSNEVEEAEKWQRKIARVLLYGGNKRLFAALLDSAANGIPELARASLVTISWMSTFLHAVENNLQYMACPVLTKQLVQFLNYDKDIEERVLASYSLLNVVKSPGIAVPSPDKELIDWLQNLSLVTWTADELITAITGNSRCPYPYPRQEIMYS